MKNERKGSNYKRLELLILQHKAIGAFVTHCGWNLTWESVAAGLRMFTWPIASEEFYNEKLVTDVLKIGVPVGDKKLVDTIQYLFYLQERELTKHIKKLIQCDNKGG